jgi:regulatory protein
MTKDDGHLAPVTYLFGPPPQVDPVSDDRRPALQQSGSAVQPAVIADTNTASIDAADSGPDQSTTRPRAGRFDRISNVSMHALGRRSLSIREMTDYLQRREFDDTEIVEEIDRLASVGLLDDDEMAKRLAETLTTRKGLGPIALAAELRRRRLDGAAIELAMAESPDDDSQRAADLADAR